MSNCELFEISGEAPVSVVRPGESPVCDASSCETIIQVGIFFDGTGNNLEEDDPKWAQSNIVRLSKTYIDDSKRNVSKIYVPGLGTKYTKIDEAGESTFGGAFGSGGEGRLLIALCSLINEIYVFVLSEVWAGSEAIEAICRPRRFFRSDSRLLDKFGISQSLNGSSLSEKVDFFRQQISKLQQKMADRPSPVFKEIALDIFGFSRGATTARVFCHWLKKITKGGKIAGIPVHYRFLGLMDTVASVGLWDGVAGAIFNQTGGHTEWAPAQHLLILPEVKNCIHMVAMHEIRKNFPLDQVAVGDVMPENCHEFAYPGSHSDVGGGYAPGALGLAVGAELKEGDCRKLSQIPLNHMFECALAAGVPMSKQPATKDEVSLFKISPEVEAAFKKFVQLAPSSKQRLSDWMLPYLIWRWTTRNEYSALEHVRNAKGEDLGYLTAAHKQFVQDGNRMEIFGDEEKSLAFVKAARARDHSCWNNADYNQPDMNAVDREAWEVRKRVAAAKPNPPDLDDFFDRFVHDSLAGFRKKLTEPTGHWRYRRVFRGDEQVHLT